MMGFELRVVRRGARLNQTRLATMLDVTRQTVGNWETGRTPITRLAELAIHHVIAEYIANRPIRVSRPRQPWQIRLRKWLLRRV